MRYLRNVIYIVLLFGLLITGIIPRFRRNDILGGFWNKLWGQPPNLNDKRSVVWFHAACVGEAILCRPVIDRLSGHRPDLTIVLSVCTPDGVAVAQKEFPQLSVFYAPYDFTWAVSRVMHGLSPSLLVIAENDFWPNLISEAGRQDVPVAIFNTRISRSEQIEHRWNGWLIASSLSAVKWWGAIGEQDAKWIKKLFGVGTFPVEVTGSLKIDGVTRSKDEPAVKQLRKQIDLGPDDIVWVAGSTHAPEEEFVLDVFARLKLQWPKLRLVLAPRNVERCSDIERVIQSRGMAVKTWSSSPNCQIDPNDILLVDSLGQLRDIWGLADIAFVGGSLVEHGGQNILEPASYGIPVCFGPYVFNFSVPANELVNANAGAMVNDVNELGDVLSAWLESPALISQIGTRAQNFIRQNGHALRTTVDRISRLLPHN